MQRLQVRIGMDAGEPIQRKNDLYGTTVQLAARLCAHAAPEQILVSDTVAGLCAGGVLPLSEIGHVTLKGFEHPVRAYLVAIEISAG